MQQAFDLFGDPVEVKAADKPKSTSKPRAKIEIDRRKLWSDGGYLATIEEEEDDAPLTTTESFTENATIERLEQALNMAPLIRGGEWVQDGMFWSYKLLRPIIGSRTFGKRGSILHMGTMFMVQASAQKVLDETYNDTGAWLPRYAYWVFCARLRMALEEEDPYEILKAFTAVMSQHDYLDASRKGDSLRRVAKRERMREQRAAKRAQSKSVDDDEYEDDLRTA